LYKYAPQCWNDSLHRLPGCNDAGYHFGGTPWFGGGEVFNASEDFANSFAVYMFPTETQSVLEERYNSPGGRYSEYYKYKPLYYWTVDQLKDNPRWIYVDQLVNGRASP